tara:strand:+ start:2295 stop:2729 length:435 start_codon:yes stop_codon:yes gene_type:complete
MFLYITISSVSALSGLGYYYSITSREIALDMSGTVDTPGNIYIGSTQNAIMNPNYSKPILYVWIINILLVASTLFTYHHPLYSLLLALITFYLSTILFKLILPKSKIVRLLLRDLIKRKNKFIEIDDRQRANACEHYITKIQNL